MTAGGPVVVVGGGVIGLCAAYSLRRRGLEVTVLEAGTTGGGASHGNAGWVVPSMSAPLAAPGMLRTAVAALARKNGPLRLPPSALPAMLPWLLRFWTHCTAAEHDAALRATGRLAADAMQLYDALADDGLRFEMSTSGLLNIFSASSKAERAATALRPLEALGYPVPALLDRRQLLALEPALGPSAESGFLLSQERAVEPAGFAAGLSARLRDMGVAVVEGRAVTGFQLSRGRVTAVTGPETEVEAGAVVVAAGALSTRLLRRLGVRLHMKPGKGYSISGPATGLPRRPLLLAEAKVAVTPFAHRTRIAGLMEFAGFDARPHRHRLAALAAAAQPYLPPLRGVEQWDGWSGLRPVTPDGLPVIDRIPTVSNAYVATGHAMLGVTLAPSTGEALADLMLGDDDVQERLRPFRLDRRGLARLHAAPTVARSSLVTAGRDA